MQLSYKICLILACLLLSSYSQCTVPFCKACLQNTTTTCVSCLTPFYAISSNGTCVLCSVSYCKSCPTINTCSACLDLFVLSNNACIFCNITNCASCSSNQNCTQCSSGLTLTNGTCQATSCPVSNCLQCSDNQTCSACQGTFMLYNNTCISCNISNCLACSGSNICISCPQSYTLQNNTCVLCSVSSCNSCNSSTNLCSTCENGYSQSNGYCIQSCPSNCQTCNNVTGACAACLSNYTLKQNTCILCSIDNCKSCSLANQCSQCASTYTLFNSTCQCNNTECMCNSNQTFYQGSCVNNCGITNCITCLSNICSACLSTHRLINGSICQAFCLVENCQVCPVTNVCTKCLNSLIPTIDGTKCVSCSVNNCALCSSDNVCKLCQPGYSLASSSSCILCNIEFAQYCPTQEGACQYCYFPYAPAIDGLSCVICLFPCVSCNSDGSCLICDRPFSRFPTSNGTCYFCQDSNCGSCDSQNPRVCLSCLSGFQNINGACHGNCLYSGCKRCDINNPSICLECLDYYYLDGKATCQICTNSYICQKCSPGDPSICLQCKDKFYLSENSCLPCPDFCSTCTSSSVCQKTSFDFGYTFILQNNTSILSKCDTGCLNCVSNNPLKCYQCLLGFYLADFNTSTLCLPCSNNCQVCNGTACLTCFPGAFLQNSICIICSKQCVTCDKSASNCTSCLLGDILTSANTCNSSFSRLCDQNCGICISKNGSYVCQSCTIGFVLKSNACLPCPLGCSFCNTSIISQCLICAPMFYIQSNLCYACKKNCLNCLSSSDCILCLPGYIMTSKITCVPICNYPCSTCSESDPNSCFSCLAGYALNSTSKTCISDVSCSQKGTCVTCPAGYIFSYNSISNQSCTKCQTNSSSCLRCDPSDNKICLSCLQGYFVSNSTCSKCPASCFSCYNNDYCLACADGYMAFRNLVSPTIVLISHYFQGIYYQPVICIKCYSPCQTCYFLPSYCTSCVSKYTLSNNRCVSNLSFLVSLTLNPSSNNTFVENYHTLVTLIANKTNTFINQTSIIWIKYSSVNIRLVVNTQNDAGSSAANQQQSNLNTLLASSSIAGMQVINSQLIVQGADSSTASSTNLGVIIAVVLVVTIVVVAVIIIIVLFKRWQSKKLKEKMYESRNQSIQNATEFVDIQIKQKNSTIQKTISFNSIYQST